MKKDNTPRFVVTPNTPGDLIPAVGELLSQFGLIKEVNDFFLNAPVILQAMNFENDRQRVVLNRFFYSQLSNLDVPTQEPRYSLLPDGSLDQWFEFFRTKVLPYCVEFRLPKRNWS
jgi:hypothetical protein